MEHLQAYNRKLLENILPVHVAEHFLSRDKNIDVNIQYNKYIFIITAIWLIENYNNTTFSNIFLFSHYFRIYIMNNVKVLALCLHQYQISLSFMLSLRQTMKVLNVYDC